MIEKITFKELVEKISAKTAQSEQSADDFIHQLTGIIESSLSEGEKISISGFGKFELRWMDERKGRNPQTGEEITIPGQNKVVFKPYKALREHVNKPYKDLESRVISDSGVEDKKTSQSETLSSEPPAPAFADTDSSKQKSVNTDSADDLIAERESPIQHAVSPTRLKNKKEGAAEPLPVADDDKQNFVFEREIPAGENVTRKTHKNNDSRWSYTAAFLLLLLSIFLIVFMIYRPGPTPQISDSSVTEQTAISQIEEKQDADENSQTAQTDEISSSEAETRSPETGVQTHVISRGETLWNIAQQEYTDSYLWPIIYDENSREISNPNRIAAGSSLRLPVLNNPQNLSRFERERVALGYISVYDWILENQPENARYYLWAAGSFSQEVLRNASDRVEEADLVFATQ